MTQLNINSGLSLKALQAQIEALRAENEKLRASAKPAREVGVYINEKGTLCCKTARGVVGTNFKQWVRFIEAAPMVTDWINDPANAAAVATLAAKG